MSRLIARLFAGAFCLAMFMQGAAAQQAGADDMAMQMMRIVEMRLKQAKITLSSEGRRRVWEYVGKAADEAYERNRLSEVVPKAEALADRLVDAAARKDPARPAAPGQSAGYICRSPSPR